MLCTSISVVVIACIGCSARSERTQALRSEAGRVAEATRKVREAPNHGRQSLIKALDATECSADDVCALKKKCSDAYSLQEKALDGLSAIRHATTGASAAEPVPSGAAALLNEVTTELEKAKTLAQDCAALEGAARRKYSL